MITGAEGRGLDDATASARLIEFGYNDLVPKKSSNTLGTWLLRLVGDPMVILLVIAGVTYFALGDRFDGIVVLVALAPIFLVGAVLEYRSDRALERLNDIAPLRATVLRGGENLTVPARMVVPGDVLILREGDVVAADATLVESRYLLLDEMSLTGESLPVEKTEQSLVYASTVVRSGFGKAVVEFTGARTEYGRIGRELERIQTHETPIERSIKRLVFQVGVAVLFICVIVFVVQRWHGDTWPIAIIAAVSLAMAAIPEELPMVYTLYLALGAYRLAKDNALVRRLSSVETLGSTSVICVDKTGTLTYGTLAIDEVYCSPGIARDDVLTTAALASPLDSKDPLDLAILSARQNVDRSAISEIIPFDPERAYAAAVMNSNGTISMAIKGAYERLLEKAENIKDDAAEAFILSATRRGARVIAVATTKGQERWTIVGLIAFADPVRETMKGAIAECRRAGIRFMMLTGDHPETARSIARSVGIDEANIFARVRPEDKLRIVRDLHAKGEVVAMTGDGTNDALALREADIGVAMGKTGTEVARAAADLVLLDDDITTIVRAVADGRRIFHNLRHAFSYLNAFHAPLLLSALVLPLLGAPILLLPIHLIWLEIIVHPTSALVFENDPPDSGLMVEPPRASTEGLLRPRDWRRALVLGITLAIAVIALYLWLLNGDVGEGAARGAALIAMILGQTMLVFVERAGSSPLWTASLRGNAAALPIIASTIASLAVVLLVAPVASMLHVAMPPLTDAAIAAAVGVGAVLWTQPYYALKQVR